MDFSGLCIPPKDHELLLQLNKHKMFSIKTSLLRDYVCFKMRAVNLHKTILGSHKLRDNENEGAENLRRFKSKSQN